MSFKNIYILVLIFDNALFKENAREPDKVNVSQEHE